jgi:outer membrane lipoprotein-sorting protein
VNSSRLRRRRRRGWPDTAAGHAAAAALALVLLAGQGKAAGLAWDDVVASYGQARDYTTLYEKEERAISNGELQTIRLSFRKPLDVRLDWLNKDGKVDQTAVYRQGQNEGKVLARRSGLFGKLAGTLTLDPHSSVALQDSRHPIMEVGIGHVIDSVTDGLAQGRLTADPVRDATLDGRQADQFAFQVAAGAEAFGVQGVRRGVVWVDREMKLPVKVELLGEQDSVLERHRFKELKINVGLTDATFVM